jgi:hypothetical protein
MFSLNQYVFHNVPFFQLQFLRGSIQKEKWHWASTITSIPSSIIPSTSSYKCISTLSLKKLLEFLQFLQVEYYEGKGSEKVMPILLQVPTLSTITSTTHYLDQLQTMVLSMLGFQLN